MFAAAVSATTLSALVAGAFGVSVLIFGWLIRLPRVSLLLLLFSVGLGQAVRFPLPGQGGGLLLSDLAVVALLLTALFRYHGGAPRFSYLSKNLPLLALYLPFILWSAFSLIVHMPQLGSTSALVAGAYWARLATHLLLLPALLVLCRDRNFTSLLRRGLTVTIGVLTALGFAQVWLLPSLQILTPQGWDPHQGRLVSTWLDPNFFGAFLVLVIPFLVASIIKEGSKRSLLPSLILLGSAVLALLYTQSRSAMVACGVALAVTSPLVLMQLFRRSSPARILMCISLLGIAALIITAGAISLYPRFAGLVVPDATVQLRLDSMASAWQLAQDHPWIGVGAGAYQFAAREASLISDFKIHSRAGADNSLITIWVTTGIVGLITFLIPWIYLGQKFVQQFLRQRSPYAMAALIVLLTLWVHGQFVNSLLYAHLIITINLLMAQALSSTPQS